MFFNEVGAITLLKTFYCGPNGWRHAQQPDGTVLWFSPTGHRYTTKPGASLLFPLSGHSIGELRLPVWKPTADVRRGIMMPARLRPRAADRAARYKWERDINAARITVEAEAKRLAACNDPSPF